PGRRGQGAPGHRFPDAGKLRDGDREVEIGAADHADGGHGASPRWVSDKVCPSGSLNHATRDPSGVLQIPSASWSNPSYRSSGIPRSLNCLAVASMSRTCQPSTVYGGGDTACTFWTRSSVPFASNTSANGPSSTNDNPSRPWSKRLYSPALAVAAQQTTFYMLRAS